MNDFKLKLATSLLEIFAEMITNQDPNNADVMVTTLMATQYLKSDSPEVDFAAMQKSICVSTPEMYNACAGLKMQLQESMLTHNPEMYQSMLPAISVLGEFAQKVFDSQKTQCHE